MSSRYNHNQETTHRSIIPCVASRLLVLVCDYVPGLSSYFFWNHEIDALKNRSFKEDMTITPLPLPKEVFGIEEPMKIDGLEIFDHKNKEYNPIPEKQKFLCARDFTEAYSARRITPTQVCEKLIDNINQSCSEACDPPLYGMYQYHQDDIMAQAEASTTRYIQEQSLGPLDGVPVAIKDELDVEGYETQLGTSFFNRGNPASRDAFLIKKLKDQGAIIIGKTNMGFGITTSNPNMHITRNPYNSDHYCGGSSGGSACVVSSGLCPIAIGCDAGGSIRIPSSFCGIYGLKPTYGRISSTGDFQLCNSVGVAGPMAACVDDLALTYYAMAGQDAEDPKTLFQPSPTLHGIHHTYTLSDLKIGIFSEWNKQVVDPAITYALQTFINEFKLRGAEFIEIDIPELEDARIAHLITVTSEFCTTMNGYKKYLHLLSPLNIVNIATYNNMNASDYIKAQHVRTRMMRNISVIFSGVNLILTPTCAITAPPICPRALKYSGIGEIDSSVTSNGMMYTHLANFIGIPAITIPAGYNDKDLPIGLQFMAKWYDEAMLLRIAKASEEILGCRRRKPSEKYWFGDLL
ncbi:36029_t:CDS:10 [Gigaspora margarita]|uniref:36029_t:CDS:1 n=1 Tax=Gigaspora margarita TaxID=4874 RepID=A0ABN7UNL9_GIGMA|nr:36029_t:CDS:10 [Gigaspora margarita]